MRFVYSIILTSCDLGYASSCTLSLIEPYISTNAGDCESITELKYDYRYRAIPDELPHISVSISSDVLAGSNAIQQAVHCKVDNEEFGLLQTEKVRIGFGLLDRGTRIYRPDEAGVICRRIWDLKMFSVLKTLSGHMQIADSILEAIRNAFPKTVTGLKHFVNTCSPGAASGECRMLHCLLPVLESKRADGHTADLDEKVANAIDNWDDDVSRIERTMNSIFKPKFDIEVAWNEWMGNMGTAKLSPKDAISIKKYLPKTLEALFDIQWDSCLASFITKPEIAACDLHKILLPALATLHIYVPGYFARFFHESNISNLPEFDEKMAALVRLWTGSPVQMKEMHALLMPPFDFARALDGWSSDLSNVMIPSTEDIADLKTYFFETMRSLYIIQWKLCSKSFAHENVGNEDVCGLHKILIPELINRFDRLNMFDHDGETFNYRLSEALTRIGDVPREMITEKSLSHFMDHPDEESIYAKSDDDDDEHEDLLFRTKSNKDESWGLPEFGRSANPDVVTVVRVLEGMYINLYTDGRHQLTVIRQFTKVSGKQDIELSIKSLIIGDLIDYAKEDSKIWKKFNDFYENMLQLGVFKQCGFLCDIKSVNALVGFENSFEMKEAVFDRDFIWKDVYGSEWTTAFWRNAFLSSDPDSTGSWKSLDIKPSEQIVQAHVNTILFAAKEFVAIENKERKMFTVKKSITSRMANLMNSETVAKAYDIFPATSVTNKDTFKFTIDPPTSAVDSHEPFDALTYKKVSFGKSTYISCLLDVSTIVEREYGIENFKRVTRFRNYIPKVDKPESDIPFTKWECQTMIGNLRLVESDPPEKKNGHFLAN